MQKRTLGRSGLEVSAMGLGCVTQITVQGDRYPEKLEQLTGR